MEEIDWKVKYTRVCGEVERLNAEQKRLEVESESRKKLAEALMQYVHDLKHHAGSICFCMQEPCDKAHRTLYNTRK